MSRKISRKKTSKNHKPSQNFMWRGALYRFFFNTKGQVNKKRVLVSVVGSVFVFAVILAQPIRKNFNEDMNNITQSSIEFLIDSAGLGINTVHIQGTKYIQKDSIYKALALSGYKSIFTYDLQKAYQRIMRMSGVRNVEIRWLYPNQLKVFIEEAKPLAIYRNAQKKEFVLADNGQFFYDLPVDYNRHLLTVEGYGAPAYAPKFIQYIREFPYIYAHIQKISLIGKRRWDITMDGGVVIKLPEKNYIAALETLRKLSKNKDILNKDIVKIDMRIDGRIALMPKNSFFNLNM